MQEQTWIDSRCDRSKWGAGEWDGEPDKVQWKDEATSLACLAKRNPSSGAWCGYVGVSDTHPWHKKDYSAEGVDVDVHGGLTYADECQEGPPDQTICHVPAPGEPDSLWWFGFDCMHAWDVAPGYTSSFSFGDAYYRTLDYVRRECTGLARQLAALPSAT